MKFLEFLGIALQLQGFPFIEVAKSKLRKGITRSCRYPAAILGHKGQRLCDQHHDHYEHTAFYHRHYSATDLFTTRTNETTCTEVQQGKGNLAAFACRTDFWQSHEPAGSERFARLDSGSLPFCKVNTPIDIKMSAGWKERKLINRKTPTTINLNLCCFPNNHWTVHLYAK